MVMQREKRVLSVEEFLRRPPKTEDELRADDAAMLAFLATAADIRAQILAQRGGVPLTEDEIDELLADDDQDEAC